MRVLQVIQGAAQVGGQCRQGRIAVVFDRAAPRPADHAQQMRIVQGITVIRRGFLHQLAHAGQVAVVIQINVLVAVWRDHAGDATASVGDIADRFAILREDAAVGDCQLDAVGILDLAHALGGADAIQRTVGRGEVERRLAEFGRCRVVRPRSVQVVQAVAGADQLDLIQPELPGNACVRGKGRGVVAQPGDVVFDDIERIADTLAIRQGEQHACADTEGIVSIECLAAGGGHIGLQINITQLEVPAIAEAARDVAVEGIVLPAEIKGMPGDLDTEIDISTQVLAGLGRRGDLDAGLHLGDAASVVPGHQAQTVKTVGQRGGIDRGERTGADRDIVLGQDGEVFAALTGDLQSPLVEIDVEHRTANGRGGRQAGAEQRHVKGNTGRLLVVGVLDPNHRRGRTHHPIGIHRCRGNGMFAQPLGNDAAAAVFIERDRVAVEAEAQADDVGEAVGNGVQQHFLSGDHREAGGEFDHHLRRHRSQRSLEAQRFGGVHEAIGNGGQDQVLANLAGARRPADQTGLGIESRAFGQAEGRVDERRARIRVGAVDREFQRAAQLDGVVGNLQRRRAVDVGDRQLHRDLALGVGGIDGRETQTVVASLLIARRPSEFAGARIETRACRHGGQSAENNGIAVHFTHRQGELQQGVFPPGLREQRHQNRCLVDVGDLDGDGLAAFAAAVAHRELDARIVAGLEDVRRPVQHAVDHIETGTRRQVADGIGQHIVVGIGSGQVDLQRLAFQHDPVTDRRQHRRRIGVAHDQVDGLRIAADRAGAIVAVVRNGEAQVVCAQIARGRGPFNQGSAVGDLWRDRHAGGQCAAHRLDGEVQAVLIEIGSLDQE